MSCKNYQWEVIAHDYHSPLFRNQIWTRSLFRQAELLEIPRAVAGFAADGVRVEYLTDISTWGRAHEALRALAEGDVRFLRSLIERTEIYCQDMVAWGEKFLPPASLNDASPAELCQWLDEFTTRQETAYALGIAPVILDFSGFSFVESNLEKVLRAKAPPEKYQEYYQVFTAPPAASFSQDQETALLELLKSFYHRSGFRQRVLDSSWIELRQSEPEFAARLQAHAAAWGWVYYVYAGPAFSPEQFLEFVRGHLKRNVSPEQALAAAAASFRVANENKARLNELLRPTGFEQEIFDLAGLVVWSKPRRKDYQSRFYWQGEFLLKEIGRRLALTLAQVRAAPFPMLRAALLDGSEVDAHIINEIIKFHLCLPNDDGTLAIFYGEEARAMNRKINRPIENQDYARLSELRGTTACPGTASGTVRIINTISDIAKMRDGDILISSATTPSIITALRRAAAIVTDEGGLTCHAAIVSRELNIPSIVGTKIATKVFADGDRAEVDATLAIIKRLNS